MRGLNIAVNIGARIGSNFNSTVRQAENRLERMGRRVRMAGAEMKAFGAGGFGAIGLATAAGYGVSRAMRPFVDFEDGLARLGNVAEINGTRLDAVGKRIVSTGAKYGIGGRQALAGAQDFLAAGLKIDTALKALDPTLKLAKVAGIEDAEASQVGIAAMQNLGVRDSQLGSAYDILAKAGKLGRFEVDDLAKAMPGLASRASALGMSGLDGVRRISAQAQIARESARDADEAANNLLNFYDKLSSGETQRKFAKMGVSVEGVFKKSKAEGTDFVDAMLDEIGRLTKGGTDSFALSALFEDRQARQGAAALVRERAKLQAIYAGTGNAGGTLDADFANLSKTTKFGLDRFAAGLERVGISLGKIFGPMLGSAAMGLATMMERFADWAERHPRVIKTIGLLVGGFIGLKAAALGGAWVLGSFIGSIGGSISRLGALWKATLGPRLAVAARLGMSNLGSILLRGVGVIGRLLLGPVGWVLLAAGLIYKFWPEIEKFWNDKFVPWLKGVWQRVKDFIANIDWRETAMRLVEKLAYGLGYSWVKVTDWFEGAWKGMVDYVAAIDWAGVGKSVGLAVLSGLTFGLSSRILGDTMASGIKNALPSAVQREGFFSELSRRGGGAFSQGMNDAKGRALGGSVSAGSMYQWHERGREFFVPGRSGTVIPAHVVAALNRGGGGGGFTHTGDINIYGATDPQATVREIDRYMRRMAGGQAVLLSD